MWPTCCTTCQHYNVCKDREEFEYLNELYRNAMKTYRPDYKKPKLSDIPYIIIQDLKCKNYRVRQDKGRIKYVW